MKISESRQVQAGQAQMIISDVVRYCPQMFTGHCLLVATIDSGEPDIPVFGAWADRMRLSEAWAQVGSALFIRPALVGSFTAYAWLGDFDEVYVLAGDAAPPSDGPALRLTSDCCDFGEGLPGEFIAEFNRLNAVRYFSDGLGLNFCVRSMEDALAIGKAEIEVRTTTQSP